MPTHPSSTPASAAPAADFTTRDLRHAFGAFPTGITVVTTRSPKGVPHGATVNAFTAVSLDPPLAQVTLMRSARSLAYLESHPFAINILAVDQLRTALHFAGRPLPEGPSWSLDRDVPILDGNSATLECRTWKTYDGGDHLIVIGEVLAVEVTNRPRLAYVDGKFRHVGDLVDGMPWDHCGDGTGGLLAGAHAFRSFAPAAT